MTERTSARVARIAAKVLALRWEWDDGEHTHYQSPRKVRICLDYNGCGIGPLDVTLADIRALAASCLTQSPPKGITHRQKAFKAAPKRRKP